ncbi:hypothetical protein BP6252_03740 [Coleophoma cylindrospora]|uniref:Uncharacterized protein n=1 Tax=Coleophoma cylindrospora TaxID=1849047 RepID=A0A3D8SA07_9HELO|nr:hypothetical protein BP6252_03740 [Coleophoma cylindrospora]
MMENDKNGRERSEKEKKRKEKRREEINIKSEVGAKFSGCLRARGEKAMAKWGCLSYISLAYPVPCPATLNPPRRTVTWLSLFQQQRRPEERRQHRDSGKLPPAACGHPTTLRALPSYPSTVPGPHGDASVGYGEPPRMLGAYSQRITPPKSMKWGLPFLKDQRSFFSRDNNSPWANRAIHIQPSVRGLSMQERSRQHCGSGRFVLNRCFSSRSPTRCRELLDLAGLARNRHKAISCEGLHQPPIVYLVFDTSYYILREK